jgi:hypothetical protein
MKTLIEIVLRLHSVYKLLTLLRNNILPAKLLRSPIVDIFELFFPVPAKRSGNNRNRSKMSTGIFFQLCVVDQASL